MNRKRKKLTRATAISAGFGSVTGSIIFTTAVILFLYLIHKKYLEPRLDKVDSLHRQILREMQLFKQRFPSLFTDG